MKTAGSSIEPMASEGVVVVRTLLAADHRGGRGDGGPARG